MYVIGSVRMAQGRTMTNFFLTILALKGPLSETVRSRFELLKYHRSLDLLFGIIEADRAATGTKSE